MAVLVQMIVKVPDVEKFAEAHNWMNSQPEPKGFGGSKVLYDENDPSTVCMLQEWLSHDFFHASSEKMGDEFNKRAGTEGLEWTTYVWVPSDIPDA